MLRRLLALGARAALALITNSSVLAGEAAGEAAGPDQSPMLPAIVVTEAVERAIANRVLVTGSIAAVEEVHVSPLVDGLSVRTLYADLGDRVEQGSTLAVLNDDALLLERSRLQAALAKAEAARLQLQAQRAEAEANAAEAARAAGRAERLSANKTVSPAEADRLKAVATALNARLRSAEQALGIAAADITLARAQLNDAELRLARTAVVAPVGGVVSMKNGKVGAIASGAGQPLYTIIRDGAVELKADVAEADLVELAVGQPAAVTLAGGGAAVPGTVRLIAPTVDPQTRLGTVHIALADITRAWAGMYASATITTERKRAIILPRASVTTAGGGAMVRKVEGGVVRLVPVTVGIQEGPYVEILSGLRAGEQAVAKAGAFVRDGDRIVPVTPTSGHPNATPTSGHPAATPGRAGAAP